MNNLLRYIDDTNERFMDKIVELIKDDQEWLETLGIAGNEKGTKIKVAIRKQLSNPENAKTIDSLLNYAVNEYDPELNQIELITHYVSADSYTQHSALYVFKCSNLYFCYSIGVDPKSLITKEPQDFCLQAAASIVEYHELESKNQKDEYLTDFTNELTFNFDFQMK